MTFRIVYNLKNTKALDYIFEKDIKKPSTTGVGLEILEQPARKMRDFLRKISEFTKNKKRLLKGN